MVAVCRFFLSFFVSAGADTLDLHIQLGTFIFICDRNMPFASLFKRGRSFFSFILLHIRARTYLDTLSSFFLYRTTYHLLNQLCHCKIEKIIVQNDYLWIWYDACRKCMLIYSVDVHCTCVKNTCVQICAWFVSASWSAMTQTNCSCRWFEHNQFKSQIHIWVSVNFISNRWFNNNGFSMHMEMMNDCKLYYGHPHSMSCTHTDWNRIDLICSGTCFSRNMNFSNELLLSQQVNIHLWIDIIFEQKL